MLRLIHTADWQIGRVAGRFGPDDAVPLAEARLAVVERIAARAAADAADAILVAGDVFDAQAVSARTIRRLFDAMGGFAGPWIVIPGNHDAALAEGVWRHALRLGVLPPQVHLALEPGTIELPQLRLAVLCAPLTQRHTHDDLTAWFDSAPTPSGWWRVGLAHGAVQGVLAPDIDSANPIAPDRAARAGLHYLGLGDWHGTRRIDARTWYSGTPEPDRFRANDAGQVLWVTLAGDPNAQPEPRVEPLAVARHRWLQEERRLDVPSDIDALEAWLAGLQAGDVVELSLNGTVDLAARARIDRALDAAEARVRCLQRELAGLQLQPTDDDIAALNADGYLGEVIAELRDTVGDDARRAQDALALLTTLLQSQAQASGVSAPAAPVARAAQPPTTPQPSLPEALP